MSTFNQFFALSKKTTAILNKTNSTTSSVSVAGNYLRNSSILSGALVANTPSTVYSHTGSGSINFLAAYTTDATARTIRIKLTLDGEVVYDKTSSSITAATDGLIPIGVWDFTNKILSTEPIAYNESVVVEVASSLSETDKISVIVNGYTTE